MLGIDGLEDIYASMFFCSQAKYVHVVEFNIYSHFSYKKSKIFGWQARKAVSEQFEKRQSNIKVGGAVLQGTGINSDSKSESNLSITASKGSAAPLKYMTLAIAA